MSVSESNKIEILNTHNDCRSKLSEGTLPGQPRAENMTFLSWDNELQNLAQSWANRKAFQHNPARKHSQFSVGENLFMSYTSNMNDTAPNWKQAVTAWIDEHKKYSFSPIGNVSQTGHYTQVAWADTHKVGCGYSHFVSNGMRTKLYVCNYGPAGNFMGRYPYSV